MRIALATCRELPDLYADDEPLRTALRERGVEPEPVVWDDPEADWAAYDLVVIRSTWDYHERRDAFVAWAHSVPRLANPAPTIEWNTDKTYLRGLAAAGVPVVPTEWLTAPASLADVCAARGWDDVVVKPAVSAGARNTLHCPPDSADGQALLDRIVADGTAMVQPYLPSVEAYGERSIVVLDWACTHAVRRNPALSMEGDERFDATSVLPTAPELELATQVLQHVPDRPGLLYARVDVAPGPDGAPLLMELEVTEPQLFLRLAPHGAARLADAVVARAGSAGSSTTTGS